MAEWLAEYLSAPNLPPYDEPDTKWEPLREGALQAAQEPAGSQIEHVHWALEDPSLVQRVLCALARDGVVVVRDLVAPSAACAVREQIEPYMGSVDGSAPAPVGDGNSTNKLADPNGAPAGHYFADNGRRAGAVLARAEASWGLVLHPLLIALCEGVLGRQVLMKSRTVMQKELFHASPQSLRQPFRQHPYQLDFTGVVEAGRNRAQDTHLDFGKHIYEFRGLLDASFTVMVSALSGLAPPRSRHAQHQSLKRHHARCSLRSRPLREKTGPPVLRLAAQTGLGNGRHCRTSLPLQRWTQDRSRYSVAACFT